MGNTCKSMADSYQCMAKTTTIISLQLIKINEKKKKKKKRQRNQIARDQIANVHWIIKKAREFQKKKKIYVCFIDYAKAFDCVNHNKL